MDIKNFGKRRVCLLNTFFLRQLYEFGLEIDLFDSQLYKRLTNKNIVSSLINVHVILSIYRAKRAIEIQHRNLQKSGYYDGCILEHFIKSIYVQIFRSKGLCTYVEAVHMFL